MKSKIEDKLNLRIDVILLTKNSYIRNHDGIFEECLSSIRSEIPVNQLIVVDAYSDDETLNVIRKHFPAAKIILSSALRGGTHDLLVKTELVKKIAIPADLHNYEDAFIKDT